MGSIPHALLDDAAKHPKLLELAIRALVFAVHQQREASAKLSESSRQVEDLQNDLHSLVEGSLQKAVKDLVSSANTTLLRARDFENLFIQQILSIIDRRPLAKHLEIKRVNSYPAKRKKTTTTTTTIVTNYTGGKSTIPSYFK